MKLAAIVAGAFACYGASPEDCVICHRKETSTFRSARMTRALSTASSSSLLSANRKLTVNLDGYSYSLTGGEQPTLSVSDGSKSESAALTWAFGQGITGQTYLFSRNGRWYESRVSYYSMIKGLDLTMGMQNVKVTDLPSALGRLTQPAEAGQCFDCHATDVIRTPQLDLSKMRAGIQCERCHGPSDLHLQSRTAMRKLTALSTEEQLDFCGQCHRTWSQVAAGGPRGIENVRFQPYRLANSKCYDSADPRIRCTACHDPHSPLETMAETYDVRCQACHARSVTPGKAARRQCKIGTRNCTTCHMPKLDLPGAHNQFTDHCIRIARAGAAYPD
jgi:Zn finger protein HypA/HybF involved in hydrogenase expression